MIKKYIDRFMANKNKLAEKYKSEHPCSYKQLVEDVLRLISDSDEYGSPEPDIIHEIDDGYYQGTLLYVIPAIGYQPSNYFTIKVSYGSCSGCDTLKSIQEYSDEHPTGEQVKEYLTLALHIIQSMKEI